jgi:hypothetical protein
MQTRQQPTWQEREAIRAWGSTDRTRIFKELVSRQPLYHSKCDQCHLHLNAAAVRCMTCKKHLCHKCDTGSHLTMPFHRRLLCSSDTLQILLPEHFIDPKGNIIIKGMEVRIELFRQLCFKFFIFRRCMCSMLRTAYVLQCRMRRIHVTHSKSSRINRGGQ